MRKVESRWGTCHYFGKDEYVGRSVHNYGEYNPDETEKIIELAVPGKVCLDIGANIGCISQALLRCGFRVHAFEPQPEIHKLLAMNMSASGGEFTHHNIALGSAAGTAEMPKVYYSAKGNFGGLGLGSKSLYGSYNVPVETLDSYAFNNVGFIKIDVEGFEEEVLRGAVDTILRDKPILYIEDDRIEKRTGLRNFIKSLGYTYEMHQPTLYREENFFGLKKNIWAPKNYASHNLICRHC
jgi:FkbM family methyltransferase